MASGAIAGGLLSGSATKKAAAEAAAALRYATDEAKRQYNDTVKRFQPYTEVGTNALDDYQKMLYGGYDMQESPAAQYQLTQGTKAMNRALASRGLSGSGSAVNRLTELNSSIAATDWNNQYNRLLQAINIGTSATAGQASASGTYTNAVTQGAQGLANVATNQGNQLSSIYSNAVNNLQNSGLNMMALGTKSGWWGGGGSSGYQGGGGDYGSLAGLSSASDFSMMSY
jgi:hypothetical protein